MNKVKKAVIPAAGLGTRFLPATKNVPKEMLTIVDKPIILYIVEEAIKAGVEDIVIIAGRGKNSIEDFFDRSYELEDTLIKAGKESLLHKIDYIKDMANIISIRQKQALGLGHAVHCAKPVVGDEPFSVLLGDEIMVADDGKPTVTEQLINIFNETQISTVAVMQVDKQDVSKYGIIDADDLGGGRYKIKNVIEKPDVNTAPSQLALPGRYVFTSDIFKEIENTKPGKNGEIQLTDGMASLAKTQGMIATLFDGHRYDAGDKLGYLQANIELALRNPELASELKTYIKHLAGTL